MIFKPLRHLTGICLALVGMNAFGQASGWVQLTNSGTGGGLKGLPTIGNFDSNIAQASWAHQGGRGPFLSFLSSHGGPAKWVMVIPMDDGSVWRSTDGGATMTKVTLPVANSDSRPQHAVRLPNGVLYMAYAPISSDTGLFVSHSGTNLSLAANCGGAAPNFFDPRYEVYRSSDDGATWEDTGLQTVSGISVAGNHVQVDWGGWWAYYNGNCEDVANWWTDPGMGTVWSSISVSNWGGVINHGANTAFMNWSEAFRTGGSAADNYAASSFYVGSGDHSANAAGIFQTAWYQADNCGGVHDNEWSYNVVLTDLPAAPPGAWPNSSWPIQGHQGWQYCTWEDSGMQPARGGSVTAWDNPSQGIALTMQYSGGGKYPLFMGMVDQSINNVGPGGNDYFGYQHSVSGTNGFFAVTYANQVYVSMDGGEHFNQVANTLPGPVDPSGSFPFVGGRILLANLHSDAYADPRLIALTQDTLGGTAKGTTRLWVYTDAPSIPAVQISDNGVQSSGFAACTGDTITYTITNPATDNEGDPILYQWQSSSDGYTWINVGAPTSALTYTLASVSTSTPTSWRVVANSSLEGITLASTPSVTQAFSVNPAPGFSSVPGSQMACPGGDQNLTYGIAAPANATYTITVYCNGNQVALSSLHNSVGTTPSTVTTDGSGFGNFTVYVPGSMLTNNRGDGYTQNYAFSVVISSN